MSNSAEPLFVLHVCCLLAGSRSSSSSRVSAAEAAACVAAPLGSSPGTSSGFGYELLRFMQNTVQKVRWGGKPVLLSY
jgi:hypothetical protein